MIFPEIKTKKSQIHTRNNSERLQAWISTQQIETQRCKVISDWNDKFDVIEWRSKFSTFWTVQELKRIGVKKREEKGKIANSGSEMGPRPIRKRRSKRISLAFQKIKSSITVSFSLKRTVKKKKSVHGKMPFRVKGDSFRLAREEREYLRG